MTYEDVVKRMNRDHVDKLRRFSEASEEDKTKLAFDSSYWKQHDCRRYAWRGYCLDCGKQLHARSYLSVPLPRCAGVSPSPAVRDLPP